MMAKNQALSLRTLWLGERLRAARLKVGLTLEQVGDYLRLDHSSLSRFERGTAPIRPSYVKDLIGYYGISPQRERDALIRLNEDSWRKDWWDGNTDDLDTEFIDHTWLEARATSIRIYEPLLIPGLLQTRGYAEAVAARGADPAVSAENIKRLAELKLTRQRVLEGEDPKQFSAVIDETPLRRPVGGMAVLREQLAHLIKLAARPNIDVRVLPITHVGWHAGEHGQFTLFDMPDPFPDVAYIESLVSRSFLEDRSKVQQFRRAYDELHQAALDSEQSTRFIQGILKELE